MGEGIGFDEREQRILKAVVLSYIRTAFPVGSRMITKSFDFGLSAATIRNIMADLEDSGYLAQPHTSAGRIPTDKGYRFYVDQLLESESTSWNREQFAHGEVIVQKRDDLKGLLQETSRSLSLLSHYTGVVLAPRLSDARLTHLKFIRLQGKQILAIFVTDGNLVQNKILEVEEEYTQQDMDRMGLYLNERLKGSTLQAVRREMLKEMRADKQSYEEILKKLLDADEGVFSRPDEGEVYVGGTSHILDLPEYSDVERMKALFKAFEEKYLIVKLLDNCLDAQGVQVFIGSENVNMVFQDCSLVVSTYKRGDQTLGSLGVIGPTRMDYSKVIPLVDYTARLLSRILEEG